MQKLYTVEDVANMISVTKRTIHTYLKEKTLQGRKVGGQWRFTEQDVKIFMDNDNYRKSHSDRIKQEISDFLDGVKEYTHDKKRGDIRTCTIIDVPDSEEFTDAKLKKFMEFIKFQSIIGGIGYTYLSYEYVYIEEEAKHRFMIFASPEHLIEVLQHLQ